MFPNRISKILSSIVLVLTLSAGQIAAAPNKGSGYESAKTAEVQSLLFTSNGLNAETITVSSAGNGITMRDIVLVIDTTASMAFETDTSVGKDPYRSDSPLEDPSVCNTSIDNPCQPMKAVKDATLGFLDALDFPNDRVAVITMTSQTPGGDRYPREILPLTSNKAAVISAINGIKVFQPRACDGTEMPGSCLAYYGPGGTFSGEICQIYEIRRSSPDLNVQASADPSSCPSSNIGGVLNLARFAFTEDPAQTRLDALWMVIPLLTGPANATKVEANYPNGFCPPNTFLAPMQLPWCRDRHPTIRHSATDPLVTYINPITGVEDPRSPISLYDADDYARDIADNLATSFSSEGVTIFTIGLGEAVKYTGSSDDYYPDGITKIPSAEDLLQYIAECAGEYSPDDCATPVVNPQIRHGQYFYAPTASSLVDIYQIIASFMIPIPGVNLDPSTLDFGEQSINTTSPAQTVTLTNFAFGYLMIETLTSTSEFVLSNDLCSSHPIMMAGETCTFNVAFSPTTSGPKSGTISIPTNYSPSPYIVTLQGTGANPTIPINPLSLDFGDQLAGTTSPAQTVTITNTSPNNLVIDTLAASAYFATSNDLCSGIIIAPANTCTFDVVFKPRYKGIRTGSITITGNFSSSPDIVALSGTGLAPAVLLSQSEFFFGKQLVGSTSSAKTFMLTNVGTADLVIGALQFNNNEFLISNDVCNLRTLAPTQSCIFDIAFSPTSIGSKTGRVAIPVNDPISSIYNIDMFGRGINPCPTTITVANNNDNGASSLRQAIADICPGGIVTFVPSLAGQTINLASSLRIDDDLTIDGSTLALPIKISGEGRVRVFGVLNNVDATLNNLIITRGYNFWLNGAGIYNDGTLTITNSTISANTAGNFDIGDANGGAVYNSTTGSLEVINSTFFDNSIASNGGGIYNQGMVTITNSTFLGNYAQYIGGGIYNEGAATIINSTFSGNSAYQGSDIYNRGMLNLYNTILANSINGVDCYSSGEAVLGNNNLIETDGAEGNACGTTAPLNIDPQLGTLTGSPAYFPLNISSPAIDAGDDAKCATTDQRGVTRPHGMHCDIGSFELDQIPPTVLTITRSNANPTNAASVDFTVTFSESVTDVDASDFILTTSIVSGMTVSGVSGSGSTYTVTVNTGSGNGTIRLNVVDDNSIVDAASNPLGGAGVGDGDFTSGETYDIEKTAPTVVSSMRVNPSPTNLANVDFTVIFSESVTGVDILAPFNSFVLTTSPGITGAIITGVTPISGKTYIVSVNTGSGNGTIRLDVVDNNSIVDTASNPLGGASAGDGDFTNGQIYTIIKSATFADVPLAYWSNTSIERLYNAGITGGCGTGPLIYCPDNTVTRAQMAVFLLRGIHGRSYAPPTATGTVFTDVSASSFAAAWIEQLALEGITSGCGVGIYCPDATVTRAQMAVFLLRSKHGSTYIPPTAIGTVFTDVSASSFAAAWIEQLALEGVTSGCGSGKYCPDGSVTRAEMAVFLVKTFNLP